MKLSIVIPVYRSLESVVPLYEQITAAARALEDFSDHEIVLVEDCGGDGSWEAIKSLADRDARVKGIKLSRNFGQHHAVTAGLDLCSGDWVVVMDCDLQDDPKGIAQLWDKAKEGYEVINVRRRQRKDHGFRRFRSKVYHTMLAKLSGIEQDSSLGNYMLLSRKVVDAYSSMRESTRALGIQIRWLGYSTASIDVEHRHRAYGRSSYSLKKLLLLALEVSLSYSNKPLYLSIILGLVISSMSILTALWFFIRNLIWKIPILGWTSLMVSTWFLGGVIILNLGIIGLYIGRIYNETKGRPIYAIGERVNI